MDVGELITKLKVMKKNSPTQFDDYMNKLKIDNPEIYDKIKLVFKEQHEQGAINFQETPLELSLSQVKKQTSPWFLIFVVIFGLAMFLIAAFLLGLFDFLL